ncbi:MAG: hypothetical protein ACKOE2_16800 [Actinomycetales bacterium]
MRSVYRVPVIVVVEVIVIVFLLRKDPMPQQVARPVSSESDDDSDSGTESLQTESE